MFKALKISLFIFFAASASVMALPSAFAEGSPTSTPPDPVPIRLVIEGATSTLFANALTVVACSPTPSSSPSVNGYCAIAQSGLPNTWSTFGSDLFLESAGGVANDFVNGLFWTWFGNLEYGQTSLNAHALSPNEELLLTIKRLPLRLSAATTTPVVGNTTTLSVTEFVFDASFNAVWSSAASSTVLIGENSFAANSQGSYMLTVATTTPFSVRAVKTGFLDTASLLISPTSTPVTETASTSTETPPPPPPPSGGGVVTITHRAASLDNAFAFLQSKQLADGSFGSPLYTDWAAIALSLRPSSAEAAKVAEHLRSTTDTGTSVTDYERHAMALLAHRINPYADAPINYIERVSASFDGTQIGNPGLVNDDIFALFPLLKSGYATDDPMIKKITSFIISRQRPDGSWEGSVDLTAAAVQALVLAGISPSSDILQISRTYLKERQEPNGGFGNSFATSWTLQAIAALGEESTSWLKSNNNPHDFLYSVQAPDGGMEPATAETATRLWATSYAIPASANAAWGSILASFAKPALQPETTSGGGSAPKPLASSTTSIPSAPSPSETPNTTPSTPVADAPRPPERSEPVPPLPAPVPPALKPKRALRATALSAPAAAPLLSNPAPASPTPPAPLETTSPAAPKEQLSRLAAIGSYATEFVSHLGSLLVSGFLSIINRINW